MRSILYIIIMTVLLESSSAFGQSAANCDSVLAPSLEKSTSDYALAQSYMYVNASLEYEKIKNSSAESRGALASYKLFGVEYNDSKTAEQFQQKVRDRLTKEGFSMQESEARSSYRRFLSDKQVESWATCVQTTSNGGAVFLAADSVSHSAFPLRVKWFPQRNVGWGGLLIRVRNAQIDGKNEVQVTLVGASERAFIIEPDKSTNQVVLTAEIAGAVDTLTLPRNFPVTKSVPILSRREAILVRASEFVRPLNVALGGPPGANYGADVLLNAPPYPSRPNAAEFEFVAVRGGTYRLKIEYAAASARPSNVIINGKMAIENAMAAPTGCWAQTCQSLLNQGIVSLKDGLNVLRIQRGDVFPHIRKFVFEPID